jgi:predicted amidohydrolase YtcJ
MASDERAVTSNYVASTKERALKTIIRCFRSPLFAAVLVIAADSFAGVVVAATDGGSADLVLTGARIYTAVPEHPYAEALGVRDGKLVFVGSEAEAAQWIGPKTKTENLHGGFVLPGLIDSHIHATGIVDLDVCDLKSEPKNLAALTEFVRGCIERYKTPAGEWLSVRQWNFSNGNQPDAAHPTLRAALDLASKEVPIQMLGNDGHHGAFNSVALARAKSKKSTQVGLSRATLSKEFAKYSKLIGVDAHGEPNGNVNEEARALMGAPNMLQVDLPVVTRVPQKVMERLNGAGITAILDPLATPEVMAVYDELEQRGQLTIRARVAQFYDPENFRDDRGRVDYQKMVKLARSVRAKYADDPLIRADFVKLFADGVAEGNPYAVPPTLPEVAALTPYLQPIFAKDSQGRLTVSGYVDTDSAICKEVRSHGAGYQVSARVATFIKANGFYPAQCIISSGQLQHKRAVEMEFVKQFHLAGFNIHIHAIGDAGVRTAIDAIEAARAVDGVSTQHDALAHVQIVNPSDVPRMGRDHLYLACTFSWANFDPEYDMLVVPFFDRVHGNDYAALHPANGYYESAVYPFKAMKDAGAILVGGSDAPVNTHDPQPFANMAVAIARQLPNLPPITPIQRISIEDAINAYTINGARYLYLDAEAGSLEPGKSADFILLDRDILKLAEAGKALDIGQTRVLKTWFKGAAVYVREP